MTSTTSRSAMNIVDQHYSASRALARFEYVVKCLRDRKEPLNEKLAKRVLSQFRAFAAEGEDAGVPTGEMLRFVLSHGVDFR